MLIWFYTFGCKVNQYETELLRQQFAGRGNAPVSQFREADVCVINSCTVTAQADLKLRQLIHRIRRENPRAVIAVCGCYPQAFSDAPAVLPEADIVFGSNNKHEVISAVESFVENRLRAVEIPNLGVNYPAEKLLVGSSKTRGIIKIQDGCDRFCSYCIIPYARGRSRSKSVEDIAEEAKILAESGHKELVIVGINLSDYGKNIGKNLADAVEAVAKSGVPRVRLGSLEPEDFSEEIIERLSALPSLCPQFHIALQSGCDKTLREMRRRYDKAKYFTLVEALRKSFKNCAITTDIMVGFPGESDDDFKESLDTVKAIGFTDAHIFPYSPREGTPAAKRSDQVSHNVKEQRAAIMSQAVAISAEAYRRAQIGSVQPVLFEKEKSPDFHQGHLTNYQVVKVKSFTKTLYREIKNVKITEVDGDYLIGEIVKDNT